MRIFKTYYYNAANLCKFKDTFDLIKKILQDNNWTYQKLLFKFNSVSPGEVEKIINKTPGLTEYYYISNTRGMTNYMISNLDSQWEDGNPSKILPDPDSSLINQVVKGIPRPFNVPFNTIIFNDINWFSVKAKPMQKKDEGSLVGVDTDIDSSHIAISKEFYYGNKYNPIKIRVEVTDESNIGILDDTDITTVFSRIFGNYRMFMSYALEEHEKDEYKLREIKAAKLTSDIQSMFWDQKNFLPTYSNILPYKLIYDHSSDLKHILGDMPKLSPKSAIIKVFKLTDYHYVKCEKGSLYIIEKIDDFNNQTLIEIIMAPMCRRLEADFEYNGLGFRYGIHLFEYVPDDQDGVEMFIENVLSAAKYIEQNYNTEIQRIYGRTPLWYQYAQRN